MKEDNLDAVILAAAGLNRLGFTSVITELLDVDFSIPAIGQGALGLECRLDDTATIEALSFMNHSATASAVAAERALLKRCEGGCQVPIAAHGTVIGNTLTLVGFIASVDGKQTVRDTISGSADDAVTLGCELADRLLAAGGKSILEEVYQREING